MRIALLIEYRGTDFCGWQVQPGRNTVQGVLEEALRRVCGAPVSLSASGRTDAGVHAIGQVAHFDTDSTIPAKKFAAVLNNFLPPSVSIRASAEVDPAFHARKSALSKTYEYRIAIAPQRQAMLWDLAAQTPYPADADKMREAAQILVGTHDFASFRTSGSSAKTTVRTITELRVEAESTFVRNGTIRIEITADGFLYNMVRVIAAQLLAIGQGRKTKEDLERILAARSRAAAKETAPACGLCLKCVRYPYDPFDRIR